MNDEPGEAPQGTVGRRVWVRHFLGGPVSCAGTVVNMWIDALSSEAIMAIRLDDGAVISVPLTQQQLMWDFTG